MNERPEISPEQYSLIEHLHEQLKSDQARYHDDFISPEMYKKIFDSLGDLRGKRIADLGAGLAQVGLEHSTFYIPALTGKGAQVVPVDRREETIKTWNLYTHSPEELRVAPVKSDIFQLPFANASLDGCVSVNVVNIHWCSQGHDNHKVVRSFLGEMNRVLKPEGFAIISSFGYFRYHFKDGHTEYNNGIPEDQILTPSEISHAALQMGFREADEIPLDSKRLAKTRKEMNERPYIKGATQVDIVNPAAFLLKK